MSYRNILVMVDPSDEADQVFTAAIQVVRPGPNAWVYRKRSYARC
ncbi:MAG: hypothetical protein ACJAUG_003444 [Halioglobus sp.]|jgi:hypothetical protein